MTDNEEKPDKQEKKVIEVYYNHDGVGFFEQ
jgi:hypothetical protein